MIEQTLSAQSSPVTIEKSALSARFPRSAVTEQHCATTPAEPAERDAIQNEARCATRQSIPQAVMVAGLLACARWPR